MALHQLTWPHVASGQVPLRSSCAGSEIVRPQTCVAWGGWARTNIIELSCVADGEYGMVFNEGSIIQTVSGNIKQSQALRCHLIILLTNLDH